MDNCAQDCIPGRATSRPHSVCSTHHTSQSADQQPCDETTLMTVHIREQELLTLYQQYSKKYNKKY